MQVSRSTLSTLARVALVGANNCFWGGVHDHRGTGTREVLDAPPRGRSRWWFHSSAMARRLLFTSASSSWPSRSSTALEGAYANRKIQTTFLYFLVCRFRLLPFSRRILMTHFRTSTLLILHSLHSPRAVHAFYFLDSLHPTISHHSFPSLTHLHTLSLLSSLCSLFSP